MPSSENRNAQDLVQDRPQTAGWAALILAWIRPAATTRKTHHIPLRIALLIHVVGGFGIVFAFALLVAFEEHLRSPKVGFIGTWLDNVGDIFAEAVREPLVSCIVLFAIELGFLILAILFVPWGARNEPIAHSFQHAYRRTWLHTGHVVITTLIIGFVILSVEHVKNVYWHNIRNATAHLVYPPTPKNPTAEQTAEINQARQEYYRQNEEIRLSIPRPFLSKHGEETEFLSSVAVSIWFLWALMRGLAADRPSREQEIDPLCRFCGYNLTATAADARCPECGNPAKASRDTDSVTPPLWEQSYVSISQSYGFFETFRESLLDGPRLARRLKFNSSTARHRSFFGINQLICGLLAGSLFLTAWVVGGERVENEVVLVVVPGVAVFWVAFLLVWMFFCSLVVGVNFQFREGRNLLSPVTQLSCYRSTDLVVWTIVFGVSIILVIALHEPIEYLVLGFGVRDDEWVIFWFFVLLNFGCGLAHLVRLFRDAQGVRYVWR